MAKIIFNSLNTTNFVKTIKNTERGGPLWKEILMILLITLVATYGTSIIMAIPLLVLFGTDTTSVPMMIGSLYITGFTTIIFMLYVKFCQNRNMETIGFIKKNVLKKYLIGLVIGFVMFSAIVSIGILTGSFRFVGVNSNINYGTIILVFGGFLIQGMSEEVTCRGYMMTSILRKHSTLAAILVNSIMFSLMHILNPGFTILPIINLVLFGVFASVYMLKTEDIWGVSAIHSVWNFVQGSFYGFNVSGLELFPSIFRFEHVGNELLGGGTFGPEGGLIATGVLIASTIIVMLWRPIERK